MNVQHSRFPRHFCSLNLVFGRTTSKMLTAWHKRAIASARLVKTPWDSMLLILHIRHIRPQPSVDISSIRGFQWIPMDSNSIGSAIGELVPSHFNDSASLNWCSRSTWHILLKSSREARYFQHAEVFRPKTVANQGEESDYHTTQDWNGMEYCFRLDVCFKHLLNPVDTYCLGYCIWNISKQCLMKARRPVSSRSYCMSTSS